MNKVGAWTLSELSKIQKNGLNVFSCFHCGGGSTMGYKLAGYNVFGGVEIDPKLMNVYKTNHNPKHSYLMGVQEFKNIPNKELPKELFGLDILDGSPPCSSFSMIGSREKKWGNAMKFREGQSVQVLDSLFFDFIDIANKLKPKVVIAENVKGLILGKAKGYVKEIFKQFDKSGYSCQLFLLNSAFMGVPQIRERTFFIAFRNDLKFPKLNLSFKEKTISCAKAFENIKNIGKKKPLTKSQKEYWIKCKPGEGFDKYHPKGHLFACRKLHPYKPSNTITTKAKGFFHWDEERPITDSEIIRIQTFPDDYNFLDQGVSYICGMSVPPYMMQRIALEINTQWFEGKKAELINEIL